MHRRAPAAGEAPARKELRGVVQELRGLHFRLLGVVASLPAEAAEVSRELDLEPEDYGEATEIRLAVQCVLHDQIEPAITALRDAARFRATMQRKRKR